MPPILDEDNIRRDVLIAVIAVLVVLVVWNWLGLGAPWNREVPPLDSEWPDEWWKVLPKWP